MDFHRSELIAAGYAAILLIPAHATTGSIAMPGANVQTVRPPGGAAAGSSGAATEGSQRTTQR